MSVICCYRCDYHVVAVFADLIKIIDYSHPVTLQHEIQQFSPDKLMIKKEGTVSFRHTKRH